MRKVLIGLLVAVLVGVFAFAGQIPGYDREVVRQALVEMFEPLAHLLGPGNCFDYDRFWFIDAKLNGTQEGAIVVPVTLDSVSHLNAVAIGVTTTWLEVGELPMYGFYALEPNECFRDIEAGVPYVGILTGWSTGHLVNAANEYVRDLDVFWERGTNAPEKIWALGNMGVHFPGCATVTTNQK